MHGIREPGSQEYKIPFIIDRHNEKQEGQIFLGTDFD